MSVSLTECLATAMLDVSKNLKSVHETFGHGYRLKETYPVPRPPLIKNIGLSLKTIFNCIDNQCDDSQGLDNTMFLSAKQLLTFAYSVFTSIDYHFALSPRLPRPISYSLYDDLTQNIFNLHSVILTYKSTNSDISCPVQIAQRFKFWFTLKFCSIILPNVTQRSEDSLAKDLSDSDESYSTSRTTITSSSVSRSVCSMLSLVSSDKEQNTVSRLSDRNIFDSLKLPGTLAPKL